MLACLCPSTSITSCGTFKYDVYCISSRNSRSYVFARREYIAFTVVSLIHADDIPVLSLTLDTTPWSTRS